MEICRGCLSTELHVKPLDESVIHNFNLITNLNIACTEDRPVLMCNECITSLNYCIEFRNKCIASDVTLKEIMYPRERLDGFQHEIKVAVIKEELDNEFDDYIINYDPTNGDVINDAYHILAQDDIPTGSGLTQIKNTQKRLQKPLDQLKRESRRSPRKFKTKPKFAKKIRKPKEIKTEDFDIIHCGLCTKIYDSKEYLVNHLEKVHKANKVCSFCQLSCVGYPHLLAHRMEHLPEEQKGCLFCNNRHIITQETMEFHYMKVHDLGEKNEKFLCKLCSKSYESPDKLHKHMNAVHIEFKFTCDYCSKRFRTKREVRIHLACHNEEKQYECDQCDYKSKYPGGLQAHITRRHIKDKAICKPCGRLFRTNELMEEHKSNCKHTIKYTVCPICGIVVKQLRRHLGIHSKVHKFKCEKCPATYKTKTAYIVHMNKHDGIKKQQCQYCLRRFYSRSTLLKHLRIHTGEKPYVCEICSKGFTANHNLKVHMKVHGITNLIVKRNNNGIAPEETNEIFSTL